LVTAAKEITKTGSLPEAEASASAGVISRHAITGNALGSPDEWINP